MGAMTGHGEGTGWGRLYSIKHGSKLIPSRNEARSTQAHTMKDNFLDVAGEIVALGHWQNSQEVPQARGGGCVPKCSFVNGWTQQSLNSQGIGLFMLPDWTQALNTLLLLLKYLLPKQTKLP